MKGHMEVWQDIDNVSKIPIFQISLNTNVHKNDEIVNRYVIKLQMDSKLLKVAKKNSLSINYSCIWWFKHLPIGTLKFVILRKSSNILVLYFNVCKQPSSLPSWEKPQQNNFNTWFVNLFRFDHRIVFRNHLNKQ